MNSVFTRICVGYILLSTSFALSVLGGQTVSEKRSYLIAGMRSEREKLRSGHVVLKGEHWRKSMELGEFRIPVRFEVAFDHDSRSVRFTQLDYAQYSTATMSPQEKASYWERADVPHGTGLNGVDWVADPKGGTVVHTPMYDLHLAIGSPTVSRLPPGVSHRTTIKEWDIAAFGLMDWPCFAAEYHFHEILAEFETGLICHAVEMSPSGLSNLRLRADDTEYDIWIDEKQGMTPVSISRKELKDSMRESSRCDVSWKAISDVWVPVSFRISDLEGPDITQGYDLTLEWSVVNERLPLETFTPAGIDKDPNAVVADIRLGQIVIERVFPKPLPDFASNRIEPIVPKSHSRRNWLILGNVFLIGMILWIIRRQWKKS